MARADILALIDDAVPDAGGRLRAGARERALDAALARYGVDRPRTDTATLTVGDGGLAEVPAGLRSVARVLEVTEPHSTLSHRQLATPTGPLLVVDAPAGTAAWVTYTGDHVCDADTDTVPAFDRRAVAALAAADLLEQLAAAAAGDSDSTLPADTIDHRTAADRYGARAKVQREYYAQAIGGGGGGGGGGGTSARGPAGAVHAGLARHARLFRGGRP